MKIRKFFVSNSSSSSFICDVCGEDTSGMNMTFEEAEMVQCKNGHLFCEGHLIPFVKALDFLQDEEREDYDEEWRWYVPIEHCPICQMEAFEDITLLNYMLIKCKMNRTDVENEIKSSFKSYDELMTFIKGE